ncbi:hypothetical protein [Azospirillum tabaci]|uniref:hypothetical protein n=1 Tax=Azospirillum tabaci TaxID=2752310 RepID=UPI00166180A0|nr:hypothetical protein [Azospirillum tabaci]
MRDIPIIFSAPMIKALLAGSKTQTRRILKPQPKTFAVDDKGTMCDVGLQHLEGDPRPRIWLWKNGAGVLTEQKVRFAVGDRLWVRETWAETWEKRPWYRATPEDGLHPIKPIPSIHMPRRASRLTLVVEGVKVERLQDISEEDARAEGATQRDTGFRECQMSVDGGQTFQTARWPADSWPMNWEEAEHRARTSPYAKRLADCALGSARMAFANYWRRLHGDDAWAANPFVVALTFTVIRSNIDAIPSQEAA